MEVLAYFIDRRLSKHNFEGFEEVIEKECKDSLDQLWKLLDEYRPCEALYMGRGYVKEKDRPVFCSQYKGTDNSMHRTSETVHGASWRRALLENLIDLSTIDRWDGPFKTNDRTSNKLGDDMHQSS